ncbi:uncharacterized protein VTP21DRAFT_1647 [Calcarisporiella thermophila]|uniref:uncharacterized protein n=1 Tax=Calcarisporiella thermophila TaxID=911321 RepID=UPI0037449169
MSLSSANPDTQAHVDGTVDNSHTVSWEANKDCSMLATESANETDHYLLPPTPFSPSTTSSSSPPSPSSILSTEFKFEPAMIPSDPIIDAMVSDLLSSVSNNVDSGKSESSTKATTTADAPVSDAKSAQKTKKSAPKKNSDRRGRISLEGMDEKMKTRVLRNRAAAQESREKKRRYITELETANSSLKEENEHLSKRLKLVETENATLSARIDALSSQLSEIRSQLKLDEMANILLGGFREPAAFAERRRFTLRRDVSTAPLSRSGNEKQSGNGAARSAGVVPTSPLRSPPNQRSLYGKSKRHSPYPPTRPLNLLQMKKVSLISSNPSILATLTLTFSILSWIWTGRQPPFQTASGRADADGFAILFRLSSAARRRLLESVKAVLRASKKPQDNINKWPP